MPGARPACRFAVVALEAIAERTITLADLPVKSHERVFFERVPLPDILARVIEDEGRRRRGRHYT
jgi:hypothetical protein